MTGYSIERAPRAFAATGATGRYRVQAEDFAVDETLAFTPAGHGEHLYLEIEKRLQNTRTVADGLAVAYRCEPVDVGFAGQKDRRAVTRQWFSVRTPRDDVAGALPQGCRALAVTRHTRKLRRGEIAHNRFAICVRAFTGDHAALRARIDMLASRGFPNYFGPQRFGIAGANVARALDYLSARPRPRAAPWQHGLHISVGRSVLFNAVLAARIEAGSWDTPIEGDVLQDGVPTGPLWGRGRPQVTGAAAALEARALAEFEAWRLPLEHVGVAQERRVLVVRPRDLAGRFDGDALFLDFALPAGSYASVLLRELGDVVADGSA